MDPDWSDDISWLVVSGTKYIIFLKTEKMPFRSTTDTHPIPNPAAVWNVSIRKTQNSATPYKLRVLEQCVTVNYAPRWKD